MDASGFSLPIIRSSKSLTKSVPTEDAFQTPRASRRLAHGCPAVYVDALTGNVACLLRCQEHH